MVQRRNSNTGAIALLYVVAGMLIQHPIRQFEPGAIRKLNLNVVSRQVLKPADDDDFFAEVRVESVVDLARRRFVGSVKAVLSVLMQRT
jgi:hypothetical protein